MQVHLKVKNSFMHSKSHVPFVHFNPSVPCITFVPWALVRTSPRMNWGKAGGRGGGTCSISQTPNLWSINAWYPKMCYFDHIWYYKFLVSFLFWNTLLKDISKFWRLRRNYFKFYQYSGALSHPQKSQNASWCFFPLKRLRNEKVLQFCEILSYYGNYKCKRETSC